MKLKYIILEAFSSPFAVEYDVLLNLFNHFNFK